MICREVHKLMPSKNHSRYKNYSFVTNLLPNINDKSDLYQFSRVLLRNSLFNGQNLHYCLSCYRFVQVWSDVSQLEFTQETDCGVADLQIKFATGEIKES